MSLDKIFISPLALTSIVSPLNILDIFNYITCTYISVVQDDRLNIELNKDIL